VLLGPPGSGKGTLASQLEEMLGIAHLSTGDIFRQEVKRKTALGRQVEGFVSQGRLVPDELVVKVMTSRLNASLMRRGFVLDGFPRTVGQARGLDEFLRKQHKPLSGALSLACPATLLIVRLSGRQVCPQCGAIYHVRRMSPKRKGLCDRCDSRLVTREDDRVATIKKRLVIDRAEARPLLGYYRQEQLLHLINGNGSGTQTFDRTMRLFRQQGWIKARGAMINRVSAKPTRPRKTVREVPNVSSNGAARRAASPDR